MWPKATQKRRCYAAQSAARTVRITRTHSIYLFVTLTLLALSRDCIASVVSSVSTDKVREFRLVRPFGPHNFTFVRSFGPHFCLGGPEGLLMLLCGQMPHKKADIIRPGGPDELFVYRIIYSILRIFVETLVTRPTTALLGNTVSLRYTKGSCTLPDSVSTKIRKIE